MNASPFVIAREAKPAAATQLDCFVATLLAMTGRKTFFGGATQLPSWSWSQNDRISDATLIALPEIRGKP